MKHPRTRLVALVLVVGLTVLACSQPAAPAAQPTAAPTKASVAGVTPQAAPATPAAAQPTAAPAAKVSYPEKGKTITLIVPYAAGGGGDVGARLLAPVLEKELGTSVQVVNVPGAGSQIGITQLAQAAPDGYTLGFTHLPATMAIYLDPDRQSAFARKDLQPVAMYVVDPNALVVKGDSPYKNLKDLVEAAKAEPGKIRVADSGILSDGHITMLRLQEMTGARFAIVHGAGGAAGLADVLGGHVHATNTNLGGSTGQAVIAGEVKLIGVFDDRVNPMYPGATTAASQGYPLNVGTSRAISAPAAVPKPIIDLVSAAVKRSMESPELKQKADELGFGLRYMNPTELEAYWTEMENQVKPYIAEVKKQ